MKTTPEEIFCCGIRYLPEVRPDSIRVYYIHDCHLFTRLNPGTLDEIIAQARQWAEKSPYGMLCPTSLMHGEKELKRFIQCVHARGRALGDTAKWRGEIEADEDTMRLISQASSQTPNQPESKS